MTHAEAVFLRNYLLDVIETESRSTRRMIEAVPADQLDYRPHAKAMSMRELALHIVQAEIVLFDIMAAGRMDAYKPLDENPTTIPEMLIAYDRGLSAGIEKVRALDAEALLKEADLFGVKDLVVKRLAFIPNHAIHHRGQLSAYLRATGCFVPGVYGWSADEREQAQQKQKV